MPPLDKRNLRDTVAHTEMRSMIVVEYIEKSPALANFGQAWPSLAKFGRMIYRPGWAGQNFSRCSFRWHIVKVRFHSSPHRRAVDPVFAGYSPHHPGRRRVRLVGEARKEMVRLGFEGCTQLAFRGATGRTRHRLLRGRCGERQGRSLPGVTR